MLPAFTRSVFTFTTARRSTSTAITLEQIRHDPSYGTESNPKVWVMEEFKNAEMNHLGIALPKGKLRFYRRDSDGSLQFVGENSIDHTPKDETIRVYTGNSFDVVGERKRTNYRVDSNAHWMDESFEIRVRNHKKEAVTVRVVEHLYRWTNWKLVDQSTQSKKRTRKRLSSQSPSHPTASRWSPTPCTIRGRDFPSADFRLSIYRQSEIGNHKLEIERGGSAAMKRGSANLGYFAAG